MKIDHLLRFSCVVSLCVSSLSIEAITIDDDSAAQIYCVSTLSGNRGIYTIPTGGEFAATKLSGTTYIQYDFGASAGAFVSKDKVYGSKDAGYSVFAGSATSAGNENGPWGESYWNYRSPGGTAYTYEIVATDMTFNPVDEKIYGWFKADSYGLNYRLAVYDGENISVTPVGPNSNVVITALAADNNGELWGIEGNAGQLYKISKSTGELEKVGELPVFASSTGQSATFDPDNGNTLYWGAVLNSMQASLYKINVKTLATEQVYEFPTGQRFNAFYIPAKEAKKGSPAKVEDLCGRFTGEDSSVEVTFTASTQTFGGQTLSGALKYELSIDTDVTDNGTINAGEEFAKTYRMSEGSHTLTLTLANNAGKGPKATATVYVGFDVPGAVKNLVAEPIGRNQVKLSWEMPDGSLGGLIDTKAVTYSVMRFPDFEEVATDLTETTFTDEVPGVTIAEYSYTVTSVYNGEPCASASTDLMLIGTPHSIPYSQNFEQAQTLSDITYKVIDLDPNTPTWTLAEAEGNKFVQIEGKDNAQRRDYLFSAPISFKGGTEYTLRFKISNNTSSPTQLRIFLSKSRTSDDSEFVRPYIKPNFNHQPTTTNVGQFVQYETSFTPDETGDYCLGFYDFSSYWISSTIGIDDIEITESNSALTEITSAADISVTAHKSAITITGPAGANVGITSTAGHTVIARGILPDSTLTIHGIAPGIYLVSVNGKTVKTIVK